MLATASPPRAWISSTTSWAGPASAPVPSIVPPRSLTTILAPWAASISECSRPMPRPAPVTMHTRPSHSPTMVRTPCGPRRSRCPRRAVPAILPSHGVPRSSRRARRPGNHPSRSVRFGHRRRRGLRLRAPDERRRRAHVDHREGSAAAQHHHDGDGLRPPDRPGAPAPPPRPGEPGHPAAAPTGAGPHLVDRAAALGRRSQLRPRLPPALDPGQRGRGRRTRSPDHRRTAARGLRHRRADRHAGLRPGPAAVGVHPRRRAWPTTGARSSRRSTTRSPTASAG